jgi:hypothetical protein
MRDPQGTFFESIAAPGPGKKAADRRLGRIMGKGYTIKMKRPEEGAPVTEERDGINDVSYRSGGGFAVAALAMAARAGVGGECSRDQYLEAARKAFAFLEAHNKELLNDGTENIVDDYCALLAASQLLRTTGEAPYGAAAARRAESLMARFQGYWRADGADRPFFHAADAGAPVVCLLDYLPLAPKPLQVRIQDTVRKAMEREMALTSEVPNPFGLARQFVQTQSGGRRATFFYPTPTTRRPLPGGRARTRAWPPWGPRPGSRRRCSPPTRPSRSA